MKDLILRIQYLDLADPKQTPPREIAGIIIDSVISRIALDYNIRFKPFAMLPEAVKGNCLFFKLGAESFIILKKERNLSLRCEICADFDQIADFSSFKTEFEAAVRVAVEDLGFNLLETANLFPEIKKRDTDLSEFELNVFA